MIAKVTAKADGALTVRLVARTPAEARQLDVVEIGEGEVTNFQISSGQGGVIVAALFWNAAYEPEEPLPANTGAEAQPDAFDSELRGLEVDFFAHNPRARGGA